MNWQKRVSDLTAAKRINVTLETRLLDLVSELGALSQEALLGSHYGRKDWQATPDWESKFGDVLFSLICTANLSQVDVERCLSATLKKYATRVFANGERAKEGDA